MVSTASSSLKLRKQGTGDNLNTWGSALNSDVIDLIDEAVAQQVTISLTGNHTLTSTNYATNESRHIYLKFTDGGLGSVPTVTAPSIEKFWWIKNAGSTYAITFGVSGGTTVSIPAGKTVAVFSDGTDCELVDLSNFGGDLALSSIADIASARVIGNMSGSTAAPSLITVYDEDNMASDSATGLATQQSIKAYVDTIASTGDLATVAGIASEITTVADIEDGTVATNAVTDVAAIASDVTTVATNVADVSNFADRYQIATGSDPTLRADGSALQAGDMLYREDTDTTKIYTGSAYRTAVFDTDGAVFGPASATDNALTRFDGTTGKSIQDSGWTLTDADLLTAGGEFNAADNLLTRPLLKDFGLEVSAIGNVGSARTFDITSANYFTATLDQNSTFTFSNPTASGDACVFYIELTNGGAFTITWPGAVSWDVAQAPILQASGVDLLAFVTTDGGTTWRGFPVWQAA